MAGACISNSSKWESESNESFGVSAWDEFSSSSYHSSGDDSRTERGKPGTLSRKRAWNKSSGSAEGRT